MEKHIEQMAAVHKALGHPVRLQILSLLARQEEYYCGDLVGLVGLAQSTVSHHLKILKDAQLVVTEERGTFVCYRVQREKLKEAADMLLSF